MSRERFTEAQAHEALAQRAAAQQRIASVLAAQSMQRHREFKAQAVRGVVKVLAAAALLALFLLPAVQALN